VALSDHEEDETVAASPRLPAVPAGSGSPELPGKKPPEGDVTPEDVVIAYHERTKHDYRRFSASLGYMDWATQPDPFRRYEGALLVRLPLPDTRRALPYWQIYVLGSVAPMPLSIDSLSLFFRYTLSLTGWKRFQGTTWSLRANPSSGNLHPTEGYAVLPTLDGVHDRPAVYHYAPKEHGLERRADLDLMVWSALMAAFPQGSFLVGLSSIPWREAWKYGERAFRYCQHDVGHALATMRISAAALGWRLFLFSGATDAGMAKLLGLDRDTDYGHTEREHSDLIALVTPAGPDGPWGVSLGLPEQTLRQAEVGSWYGKANALSPAHGVDWPVIEEVVRATCRQSKAPMSEDFSRFASEEELFGVPVRSGSLSAESVILGRRSAVSMDGTTSISAETFFRMLARLVPTRDRRSIPWDAIPWKPRIHLGLFVHRVRGLPPGLYALARDPDKVETLRAVMRRDFLWQRPPTCPPGLHLYLLKEGDCRALASSVSCGQNIAGDGAFSLGMIADSMDSLVTYGAAFYRNLFWEAGMVGQVLYLEAEEAGIRSTGIGCYFDNPVHDVFGLVSRDWQSYYHFTVGGPVEDVRLTTLPAYGPESGNLPDPAVPRE
jgi:SagB-type dehydrogenase family enzyme